MRATTKLFSALFLGASLLATGAVMVPAQAQNAPAAQVRQNDAGSRLNIKQVYDKLEAAGYTRITEIEWDDGRYQATAVNPQGQRSKVDIDPVTGEIIGFKLKDRRN
ncbi:PepSY domain-containing protein [Parapusillimonas granuli]|uniref:PepSY domain-containing protein n=1 Tax=Parapusillimonas granuli TaxID=380911 RepID=A0A853FVG6_9BURK|nr:PepSY domain-containing protein [Parapusillimonas granuli]MBB5213768.1 hypothetical protein [Parapusillimonas granuli]MEB2398844.1 PepSY domain-containing protein [Alcaligenaceae bacterium]NYT48603.1 PepSY domain-containing protein [Parapusillimonas granuli]